MKIYFLIGIIIFCFSCAEKKQQQESGNKTAKGTPEIKFDEEMHDFGKLTAGETAVFSFVYTNTGNSDLIVENAESDCGCVRVYFSKSSVKPNEKGKIEVEFDSSGLFGRQLKTIEIQSNCKETKQLVIFAEVKNELFEIKS